MTDSILAQTRLLNAPWGWVAFAVAALLLLAFGILVIDFGMIYLRALFSGAKVTFTELIALHLRHIPLRLVVDNRIAAVRSGLPVSIDELSTHVPGGRRPVDGGAGVNCRPQSGHPSGL